MPRYSDDWVINKALFEYTTGGSCQCCAFPAIFHPNGLKGLISSVSDLETDAANAEFHAAQESPWPPEMRDSIWADRVRVRHKMKKEIRAYKEFMDEVGMDRLKEFCEEELGPKGMKKLFQMPRSEVTNILGERYNMCESHFGLIMSSVVEQVANFKLTKYDTDARGKEEVQFEKSLEYDRFGGFILRIVEDSPTGYAEINQNCLSTFLATMNSLGAGKLLHRKVRDENSKDEGGADDAANEDTTEAKSSFRSDRRIARLIIARFWAEQLMAKYKTWEKHNQNLESECEETED